jgi:ABC-type branched-subunit amino acid transport system ATPase component/MFS family permease
MTTLRENNTIERSSAPDDAERGWRGWVDLKNTRYGLRPVVLISFLTLPSVIVAAAFGVSNGGGIAAPEIAQDLNIKLGTVVNIIIAAEVVAVIVSLAIGWWADRHRRSPLLGLSAIFSGLSTFFAGGVHGVAGLATLRATGTSADIVAAVPSYSLLADYYPYEKRGRVYALFGVGASAGALFAPIALAYTISHWGWRVTFRVCAIPLIIAGIVALVMLKEPVRGYWERKSQGADEEQANVEEEPLSFGEAWRTIWAVGTLRRNWIAEVVAQPATLMTSAYLPLYLFSVYHQDIVHRAYIGIPGAMVGLVGAYIGGNLVDKFLARDPQRVITVAAMFGVVLSLGTILNSFQPPLAVLVFAACFTGFGSALVGPSLNSIYSQVIPPRARTMGLQMMLLPIIPAAFILIPFAGLILFDFGFQGVWILITVMNVVAALIRLTSAKYFHVDMRNAFSSAMAAEEWRRTKERGEGKLLVCRDVDVAYDGVQVLFGVDFDVRQGEIIALLGTNGAGKSTLLRAISGSQEATNGAIVHNGRDTTHMPPHEIARRGVILMPGGRGVFPNLSVKDNLLLGTWMVSDDDEKEQRLAEVYDLFPILRERADALAGSLSGGEQQQLSLAQAMLGKPSLLMIDELSLGLSPQVTQQLIEKVREIHRRGVTIIIVEQSVNVALTVAKRAIFLEKGEVKFVGETAELLRRPDILRAVYVKGSGGAATAVSRSRKQVAEAVAAPVVLEARGIRKSFGGVTALQGVDLTLRQGEVLGVIGPNGSGKTTLFDVISGFQVADGGSVWLDGADVTGLSADERARRRLVRRFQDARLFPSLTVYETLLVSLDQRMESRHIFGGALGLPGSRRAERRVRVKADALIELLELGAYRDKFVKDLSTGLRRIVDIACVLATDPKVLLLDEPSSGIAQAETEGLAPMLRRVRHETGCSILIIEHDMPLITRVSDELIALERGEVVIRGDADTVLNDPRVIEAYLGTSEEVVTRSGGRV